MQGSRQIAQLAVILLVGAVVQGCEKPATPAHDSPRASNPNSARVEEGLRLTRGGKVDEARAFGETFLASAEGVTVGPERCKMLLIVAFSNARLQQQASGEQHLQTYAAECSQLPAGDRWDAEAGRIRRLLAGERPEDV